MENTEKRTAVVLGGTVPHAELIRQLKARGYFTVLVDYFEHPPAADFADVHCRESAMDYDTVVRIAREYHAEVILSSCLDQQMNIAIQAAEELGLPHPFSSETALKVTDKRLMKKIMMENGIPTARYRLVSGQVDLDSLDLNYPLIVKPADSCGSAGISRLDSAEPSLAEEAVRTAAHFSRTEGVLIEEFIIGTEMGVHGYVEAGHVKLLFGTCKITQITDGISMQLCNIYIPKLKPDLQLQLEEIAGKIVKAFELPAYTPFFMQVIVRNERVYVIEFSPRSAGGTTSEVAKLYTGFNLIGYSIDSYLGSHEVKSGHKLEKVVCCFPFYAKSGIFDHITGADQLRENGIVHHEILLKHKGDEIDWSKPSSANVMKYVIEGDTFDECFARMMKADEGTDILDAEGKSMRRGKTMLTYELFRQQLDILI